MDWPWLILTHAAVGLLCVVVTRWVVLRNVRVFEHEGHLAFEVCPPTEKDHPMTDDEPDKGPERGAGRVGIVVLFASLLIIVLGVQMLVALRSQAADDERDARQDVRDRAYADCLTEWGETLYTALSTSRDAATQVEAALARKDRLLDRLLVVVAQAQATGASEREELPPELLAEYQDVLLARIDAQADYRRLQLELEDTRQENPLVAPEVTCSHE